MAEERLTSSLQESLLTLLCFNHKHGGIVAGFVSSDLFDEPYRDIASRAIQYHARFRNAPGKEHIDDLFDHVLEDPENDKAETYRRLLVAMVQQSKGLNAEYVTKRITEFVERQTLKAGVLRAGQRYQQGGDNVNEDVRAILNQTLRIQSQTFDIGTRLSDKSKSLRFLDAPAEFIRTGIPFLDKRGLGSTRKELDFLIAPRGRGKSWWLGHKGKQAMLQRYKVLDCSLEMSEERKAQRYFQMLFAIAKRDEEFRRTYFDFDDLGRLTGLRVEDAHPEISLDNPKIREYLTKRMDQFGVRLDNLVIKEFPTGTLTVSQFRGYLDSLETVHHWTPDLIIMDYPDLMKIDPHNPRTSLGLIYVDLRGIAVERNVMMSAASQSNRKGETSERVSGADVAEDISKNGTADVIFTYSQTEAEKTLGLARLYGEKCRNDDDKWTLLLSQSYKTGQFVLDATPMTNRYWDFVNAEVGDVDDAGDGTDKD